MANFFPLIANATANTIEELPAGSFLDLSQSGISNTGNISGSNVSLTGVMTISGNITSANIVPVANITYSLGAPDQMWSSVYVGGNTIYLGSLQLKDAGSNTFAVYESDGVTPADIAIGNISVGSINDGNTIIGIAGPDGNVFFTVDNAANVVVISPGGQYITGLLSVTGNITGGNIGTAGNVTTGGILTDNYYYANGQPFDTQQPSGNTGELQYNSNGSFGASANLVYTPLTNQFFVHSGNIQANNIQANSVITAQDIELSGNIDFSSNLVISPSGNLSTAGNIIAGSGLFNNGLSVVGNIDATGNLNVNNVTDLEVGYPLIFVGANNYSNLVDLGLIAQANVDGIQQYFSWARNHTDGAWYLAGNIITKPDATIDFANSIPQAMKVGNITSFGNIDAYAGIFSTASISGNLDVAHIDVNTANISQSLYATGVISTSGNIFGFNIQANGNLDVANNLQTTNNGTFGGALTANSITSNTSLTSNTLAISATGGIVSSLNPGANINYDLGNSTNRWANLYLGGATLFLGDAVLTSSGQALSVNGNIIANNFNTVGEMSASGNVNAGNLITTGLITATANITGGNVLTTGLISATGNVTAGNVNAGANVYATTHTGLTVSVSGAITGGNITSNDYVSAVGNVKGAAADFGTGNITNGNLLASGLVSAGGNIIAVANISGGNVSTAGNVTAGGVLTDNLYYANGTPWDLQDPAGSNTQIQFNSNSNFGASANLTFDSATNIFQVTGVSSTIGNVIGGNINTAGLITASGNVTGGNVLTGGLVSASSTITSGANITGANLITGGLVTATGNITSTANVSAGNVLTTGLVSASGNITSASNVNGANVSATTIATAPSILGTVVSASANITGGNINTAGLVSATGNVDALVSVVRNGDANPNQSNPSMIFGYAGTTQYPQFIHTRHNAGSGLYNTIELYTSDGTQNGAFPTNAILGLSVSNGNVGIGPTLNPAYTLDVSGTSRITGNVTGGNIETGGLISATGNITGGNLNAAGLSLSSNVLSALNSTSAITTTANITGGNVLTGGVISATGNITGGNVSGTSITGSVVSASGTITGGNLDTGGTASATGNITGGNVLTGGLISATGNITGGNILGGANVNATSLTGTTVSVSGNITGGNISVVANITGGNVNTNNIVGTGLTLVSTGDLVLSTTGNINANNEYINNVPSPQQDGDAVNKIYVDNAVTTGFTFHAPVFAATTTTLDTATGGTITYTQPNGVANGVGATLTTTGSFDLIDTANIQTVGTRVLVKDQANAVQNGVYTWANATAIVRSTDADEYGSNSTEAFGLNDYFYVQSGNVNAGAAYIVSAPAGTITFGTSNITFSEFSKSQVYTANTAAGVSLNGTVINALVDNVTTAFSTGNIVVKAGAQLTTPNIGAATGTSLSVTGTVTGGNIDGGSGFISTGGNVTGGNVLTSGVVSATGSITSAANIAGGNIIATTLVQGTTVSASGNVIGGNLNAAGLSLSSNVVSELNSTSNITTTANISGGNLLFGSGAVSGTGIVITTGNITGGNISTAGLLIGTNNIIVNSAAAQSEGAQIVLAWKTVTGLTGQANSTWNIDSEASNNFRVFYQNATGGTGIPITAYSANADVGFGANIVTTGYTSSAGNVIGLNLLTAGLISATGNISGGNVLGGANVNATTHTGTTVSVSGTVTAATVNAATIGNSGAAFTGASISAATIGNAAAVVNGATVSITGTVTAASVVGGVMTGSSVSVTGTVTGASVVGGVMTGTSLSASGNITGANVIINGTAAAGSGVLIVSGNIQTSAANATANIGNVSNYFNVVHGKSTTAQYADLAELYIADAVYQPGTVLDFGGVNEVTISVEHSSSRIAGVVSTNPAHLMNGMMQHDTAVAVALTGRVPTSVVGTVKKGDMMVSAGNGVAMASATPTIGTVLGKALEDFDGKSGVIEIVVGRL